MLKNDVGRDALTESTQIGKEGSLKLVVQDDSDDWNEIWLIELFCCIVRVCGAFRNPGVAP